VFFDAARQSLVVVAQTGKALENILGYQLDIVSRGGTMSVPVIYEPVLRELASEGITLEQAVI
jgi:hypothetical protein